MLIVMVMVLGTGLEMGTSPVQVRSISLQLIQGCTNLGRHVTVVTEL